MDKYIEEFNNEALTINSINEAKDIIRKLVRMLKGSSITIKENEVEINKANLIIAGNKEKITEW